MMAMVGQKTGSHVNSVCLGTHPSAVLTRSSSTHTEVQCPQNQLLVTLERVGTRLKVNIINI